MTYKCKKVPGPKLNMNKSQQSNKEKHFLTEHLWEKGRDEKGIFKKSY